MSWGNDHDHCGEYAADGHDHYDYAEKYHRHYDDERTVERVRDDLSSYIDGLREDLSCLAERVSQLEKGEEP